MTERSPNADRLSVPYTPPSPTYIPVDSMAKIVKDLAYQVYFADPQSTDEIENNVRSLFRVSSLMMLTLISVICISTPAL